jgi:hypothetical protein
VDPLNDRVRIVVRSKHSVYTELYYVNNRIREQRQFLEAGIKYRVDTVYEKKE